MSKETTRILNELKYKDDDIIFLTIGLDADGTIFEHNYPNIGKDIPNCVEVLKKWQEKYKVGYILSTMRSGKELEDAVNWFKEKEIPLFGIQKHPTQHTWTDSPKCHCRIMIDDRNFNQPLIADSRGIPCVDWKTTDELLEPQLKEIYDIIKHNR